MTDIFSANEEQERYWNDIAGPQWVAAEEETERHTGPFGEAALAVAATAEGEDVLDVGCGCGATSIALASIVGVGGTVVGVDLSAVMLSRAEEHVAASGFSRVAFRRADAQVADLGAASFDLVFSRFGVMFFSDPIAAFANLRRALRPEGRMVFVCWQSPSSNPWMTLINGAAAATFGLDGPSPDAPGPFSLANPDRIAAVLDAARFGHVKITAREQKLHLARGESVEDWVHHRLMMGAARSCYLDCSPDRQREVRASLVEDLAAYRVDVGGPMSGLAMDAAVWIVDART